MVQVPPAAGERVAPDQAEAEFRRGQLQDALAFADARRVVVMATYPPGEPFPRLRGMGFVHQGWTFYLSTKAVWRKAREVRGNPHVTLLFYDSTRVPDHFVQIDCQAIEVTGEARRRWQALRFAREGASLERAAAGMQEDDWAGWRMEPVRVRINGYQRNGRFQETPLVFHRAELSLPPIEAITDLGPSAHS